MTLPVPASSSRVVLANGGLPIGGSTTFLINLGGEFVRRGVPVLVTSFERENPMESDFRARKIPIHVEDQYSKIFEDRLLSTLSVIRAFRPTSVISCLGPTCFEILRYLPSGIGRIGMVQSDYPEVYPPVSLYAPFLDYVAGVSKSIHQNLTAHHILGQIPSLYLPYGVDTPAQLERPLRPPGEPLRILYLGRLCRPQKRVHLFPQLLQALTTTGIPFIWTIAGEGPEREGLERLLISPAAHQQVRFLGPVSYEKVPSLLAESDVFLLISDAEGLPLSLLEAMAQGVVPVVSDLPSGVPELISADTGRTVAISKISDYARALGELHHHREELRRLANNAAREVREEFSVTRMADRWLEVIQLSSGVAPKWPSRDFVVAAPLTTRHPSLFSPPARAIRRWLRSTQGLLASRQRSSQG